ncbi:GNAT family N-acetyltransferase [Nocardia salmonicida]|uniref:GNAT family N-acetyltransferase n=1 Tax=Nocardia salmonicida TaxID=53431 RepID=UPI0033EC65D7
MSEDELRSIASADDSAVFIAHGPAGLRGISIVAVADGVVRDQLNRSISALEIGEPLPVDETVGWLRAVVVDEAVRGRGIGDRCVKAGLEFLGQKQCRITYAVSWVSGTGQESAGMLTRNGFSTLGVVSHYWSEVVDYHGVCAVCGQPCRCSAIVMRRSSTVRTGDSRSW